jgi:hypothetical protein
MANAHFTVRRGMEILGNFYSNENGDLSPAEKRAVCGKLSCRLTGDMFFESTSYALGDAFLPESPDFETNAGRKFWVYPPGKPLPA